MIKIFEWDGEWYAARHGKKLTGPHFAMGDVVLALEKRKLKPFRQGPPPLTWLRGSEGPKPFKKLLKVVAGVAKVVGGPKADAIAKTADALAKLTVPQIREQIAKIDSLDMLELLRKREAKGRKRVGVLDLIRVRRKELR